MGDSEDRQPRGSRSTEIYPERFLETVFDAIPDVIGIQNNKFEIIRYNAAGYRFLGKTPEEVKGKRCYELIGRSAPCDLCATSKALQTKKPERVEKYVEELDVWIDVRAYPVLDEDGNITQIIEHLHDITPIKRAEEERRKLEMQMLHAQKLESLGVLAGGVAHDFNNILMTILGNADLAMTELPPSSPAKVYLERIETASRRAADLCRQMLAYSGRGRFLSEMVNINEIIREMSSMLEVSISKKVVMRFDLMNELPLIEADPSQIRQVLMNLITNASEAIGDESGMISISTGVMECDADYLRNTHVADQLNDGSYVYLEISDTGCGMSPEVKGRMFDPFFTTKFTGRGLGMAAVLGIVRGHNAAIKVYSEEGKGTTVKVLFPVADTPKSSIADSNERDQEDNMLSGTILVVDDEETIRTVVKIMLTKMGYRVLTAADGSEAINVYRERCNEVDCILLDLTMPEMDGGETLRELKRIRPDVKVIMSSGYSEKEVTEKFAGKGLAGFVQKPFQMAKLREVIRNVLNE